VEGYIGRFASDLCEDYILINIPDVWFREAHQSEDYDLIVLPKIAVKSISISITTLLKRLENEMKHKT